MAKSKVPRSGKRRRLKAGDLPAELRQVNLDAAGIDVGAEKHYVAVPPGRDTVTVREFGAFTADLHALADWLEQCGVKTVAMESTGVYWIPLFELLDQRGFEVKLVNAGQVKNVSGRKSDVLDCQWIQQLHTYGLLSGAFRPEDQVCVLRAYLRQRSMLVAFASQHIQHMQKALTQMNLKLQHVINDITGLTGIRIIKAILNGQRDPKKLAELRDRRCRNSEETIAQALEGNYRQEHLFELRQALELFEFYQSKIADCDAQIAAHLATFSDKVDVAAAPLAPEVRRRKVPRNAPKFDARTHLYRITGVDLTRINGLDATTALKVISEIGTDVRPWPTVKHFTSWLSLCPGTKRSGGKVLSSKTRASANRVAAALRLAAQALHHDQSALGAYYRRMCARLGAPEAITATAHKLARMIYSMLKYGTEFVEQGQAYYEEQYQKRVLDNLRRRAHNLGYNLVPASDLSPQRAQPPAQRAG